MLVSHIFEQGTGDVNEDFYFVDGNFFGVFDGATSLTPARYEDGCTGGFFASNIAGKVFKANNAPLLTLAENANAAIFKAMKENGVNLEDKGSLWSTSAAVVRLHDDVFEWVQIGDCIVLVINEDGTHEILSDGFDHDLETLSLWKEMAAATDESILSALRGQIMKVRCRMNVSYGVLSGEKDALSFLNYGSRPFSGIRHILLFTDGLFIPKRDPRDREDFHLFSELYLQGGLSCVRDYIRKVEKTDTGCRMYPRFKAHDDMAAISIEL